MSTAGLLPTRHPTRTPDIGRALASFTVMPSSPTRRFGRRAALAVQVGHAQASPARPAYRYPLCVPISSLNSRPAVEQTCASAAAEECQADQRRRWRRAAGSTKEVTHRLAPLTLEAKLKILDARAGYVPPSPPPSSKYADETRRRRIEEGLAEAWRSRGADIMAAVAIRSTAAA